MSTNLTIMMPPRCLATTQRWTGRLLDLITLERCDKVCHCANSMNTPLQSYGCMLVMQKEDSSEVFFFLWEKENLFAMYLCNLLYTKRT